MSRPHSKAPTARSLRRQAAKDARRPQPAPRSFNKSAPIEVLLNSEPHYPGEKAGDHIKTRAAFERLCQGSADEDDFDHVAMTINIVKVRAMEIDTALADQIERAQDAMQRCKLRYLEHRRFGFDGPGMQQVLEAIEAAEAIIDASSPQQMRTALDRSVDAMYGPGAAKRYRDQAARSKGAAGAR